MSLLYSFFQVFLDKVVLKCRISGWNRTSKNHRSSALTAGDASQPPHIWNMALFYLPFNPVYCMTGTESFIVNRTEYDITQGIAIKLFVL